MIDLLVALWIILVATGVGFSLTPRGLWSDLPALRLPLAFALGSGALIGLTIASGLSGTLHSLGRWVILPLGSVIAVLGWYRHPGATGFIRCTAPQSGATGFIRCRPRFRNLSRFEVCLWLVLIGLLAKNFLAALTPEVRHDAIDYHIQLPNLYAVTGRVADEPWTVMSYLPFNIEMLFTLALLWAGDTAAKLLHLAFGVFTVIAILGMGRRWFQPWVGLFAAVLFLLQPQVAMIANACFNDLARALFETLALAVWFELWAGQPGASPKGSGRGPLLILLAVLAGLSLGVKWSSFPVFFAPLLVGHGWFMLRRQGAWRAKAAEMLALLLIPLLLFLPWCLRNLAFTGNPIYPFLNRALGLTDRVAIEAEAFVGGLNPPPETFGFPAILTYWAERLRDVGLAGSVLVYLLPIFALLVALVRWNLPPGKTRQIPGVFDGFPSRPTPANLALIYLVFASFGFLLFTSNADGRFLLPAYPLMALLVARSVEYLGEVRTATVRTPGAEAKRPLVPAFSLLLIAALLASSAYHQVNAHRDLREPWLPVLGKSREAFLKERYPLLPVLNSLPPGSLVLGAGFPARVPYVCKVKLGRNLVEERIGSPDYGPEELHRALRELGFTHLFGPNGYPLSPSAYEELKSRFATLVTESGNHRLYLLKGAELVHSPEKP